MTETELHNLLCQGLARIAPEADLDSLSPGTNIREELDIDSFDFLNFLIGINETLGIEIPEQDYEQLTSLERISSYLLTRLNPHRAT